VHVVDASAADPTAQIDAVHAVLAEIGAGEVPELLAFNKADLDRRKAGRLMSTHPGSVACSGLTGRGVPELLRAIAGQLRIADHVVELAVPVARGDVVAAIHREGEVVEERYEGEHVLVTARLDERGARRYAEFVQD
jgi:GTP-binding protein HflX